MTCRVRIVPLDHKGVTVRRRGLRQRLTEITSTAPSEAAALSSGHAAARSGEPRTIARMPPSPTASTAPSMSSSAPPPLSSPHLALSGAYLTALTFGVAAALAVAAAPPSSSSSAVTRALCVVSRPLSASRAASGAMSDCETEPPAARSQRTSNDDWPPRRDQVARGGVARER